MADWKARIEAARAKLVAAEAALSDEDRAEIEGRAEQGRILEAAHAKYREKRALDIARRLEAAQDTLGDKVPVTSHDAEEKTPGAGTFIIRAPSAAAVTAWQGIISDAKVPQPAKDAATRDFAAECTHDFNGVSDLHGLASAKGGELQDKFKELPFLATTIANLGAELGGLALEARKS